MAVASPDTLIELRNTKRFTPAATACSATRTLLCLLAYRVLDEITLKLSMVGPYENFYRELKRTEY